MTSNIIEAIVSVQRLSSFLAADELQPDARKLIEKPNLQLGDEVGRLIERGRRYPMMKHLTGAVDQRRRFFLVQNKHRANSRGDQLDRSQRRTRRNPWSGWRWKGQLPPLWLHLFAHQLVVRIVESAICYYWRDEPSRRRGCCQGQHRIRASEPLVGQKNIWCIFCGGFIEIVQGLCLLRSAKTYFFFMNMKKPSIILLLKVNIDDLLDGYLTH